MLRVFYFSIKIRDRSLLRTYSLQATNQVPNSSLPDCFTCLITLVCDLNKARLQAKKLALNLHLQTLSAYEQYPHSLGATKNNG